MMNLNGRTSVIKNQLWLRKRFFRKQSKMKFRWICCKHGYWQPFSDVGIHSHY